MIREKIHYITQCDICGMIKRNNMIIGYANWFKDNELEDVDYCYNCFHEKLNEEKKKENENKPTE